MATKSKKSRYAVKSKRVKCPNCTRFFYKRGLSTHLLTCKPVTESATQSQHSDGVADPESEQFDPRVEAHSQGAIHKREEYIVSTILMACLGQSDNVCKHPLLAEIYRRGDEEKERMLHDLCYCMSVRKCNVGQALDCMENQLETGVGNWPHGHDILPRQT